MNYNRVLQSASVMLHRGRKHPDESGQCLKLATKAARSFRDFMECYEALLAAGRKNEAIPFLRRAASKAIYSSAYVSLAKCYRELGLVDEWRRMMKNSRRGSCNSEHDALCAYEYYCGGEYDLSRETLALAEENIYYPSDIIWCAMGYCKIGDKTRARHLLKKYVVAEPCPFSKCGLLLEYSSLVGESPRKRRAYCRKLKLKNAESLELSSLAFSMWKNGIDPAECVKVADMALERAEEIHDLIECRDFFASCVKDYAKAASILSEEEQMDWSPEAVFSQAMAYLEIGDRENAARRIAEDRTNPRRTEFLLNHLELEIWKEVSLQELQEKIDYMSRTCRSESDISPQKKSQEHRKSKRRQQKDGRRASRRSRK